MNKSTEDNALEQYKVSEFLGGDALLEDPSLKQALQSIRETCEQLVKNLKAYTGRFNFSSEDDSRIRER